MLPRKEQGNEYSLTSTMKRWLHLLVCLEVDAANAQVIATTSESWHVFKSMSVSMDCLREERGGGGGGRGGQRGGGGSEKKEDNGAVNHWFSMLAQHEELLEKSYDRAFKKAWSVTFQSC